MGESLIIPAQQAFTIRVDHAHTSRALHLSPSLFSRNALELWDADDYELIESHQEISLARFLWRYCHVRPHSSLGGKTPNAVYTEAEPCNSRPGLTMSGAQAVQ
nr:transposase [Synechococcus sp. ATX 2A4]